MSIETILKIQEEIFYNNKDISLLESLKVAKELEKAFIDLGLKIDIDKIKNIDEIDLYNDEYFIVYKNMYDDGQIIKIGRLLKKLFPQKTDKEIESIYYDLLKNLKENEYMNKLNNYEFVYYNGKKIYEQYKSFKGTKLASCVHKFINEFGEEMFKIYTLNPDVSIIVVYLKDTSQKVARALLWRNTSLKKPYLDRIYTIYDTTDYRSMINMYNIFTTYAKTKGYAYKGLGSSDNKIYLSIKDTVDVIKYKVPDKIWKQLRYVAYMDTFCYATRNGLLSNSFNAIKWLHYLKDESGIVDLDVLLII